MEYDETAQKPMTDAMANAKVRAILKRGRPRVRMGYDPHVLHIGNKISIFIVEDEIHIKENTRAVLAWVYKMDYDTIKMALLAYDNVKKKYEKRRTAARNFFASDKWMVVYPIFLGLGIGWLVYITSKKDLETEKREKLIKAKVEAYAKTLPNYDDSIRLARTNAELQNALNRREQARLKVIHYNDSLRAMSK